MSKPTQKKEQKKHLYLHALFVLMENPTVRFVDGLDEKNKQTGLPIERSLIGDELQRLIRFGTSRHGAESANQLIETRR